MILNKVLDIIHKPFNNIYNSSFILKNIDNAILFMILMTFVISTFLSSDVIGYFAFTTFLLTIIRVITNPESKFKCEKFEIFLLIYFMLSIVSVAGSTLLELSLKGFFKTFIYLSFYLSVVHHLKYNKQNILPILLCITGCVSFETITALGQNFIKVDEISGWQDVSNLNPEEIMTRVYGTLQPLNPNLLGGYLVVAIPSVIGLAGYYLSKKNIKRGLIFTVISLFSVLALFLTGCRGAYIAMFFEICTLFLISLKFFWEKYKKLYLSVVGCLAGFGTFLIMILPALRLRIFSIFAMRSDSSNSFRFNVYQASVQMFKDNYLLGIGQGNQNFREIYGLYMKTGFDALSAYNIYLETAVESGIFALIAFLGFFISILYDTIKFIKKSIDIKQVIFVSTALMAIIGVMMHGFVDTVFFRPQIQIIFWTMIAVMSVSVYEN